MDFGWRLRDVFAITGLLLALDGFSAAQSFSGGSITVNSSTSVSAHSTATVSGLAGTITSITLKLNGVSTTNLNSAAVLLSAPGASQNLDILSGACNNFGSSELSDSAAHLAVFGGNGNCNAGTYRAADYFPGQDVFPGGPSSYVSAGDGTDGGYGGLVSGTGTFANTFIANLTAAQMNGTWTLYVASQVSAPPASGSIGSWTITFTTSGGAATTTTLSAGTPNPSFTSGANSSVSLSATVTSSGVAVGNGTVTFHDNTTGAAIASNVAVSSSGVATAAVTFSAEGNHDLYAVYNGGAGFSPSQNSNHVSQAVNNHAVLANGTSLCNQGAITIPNGDPATGKGAIPYPSSLILGGGEATLSGIIQKVTVSLNGLSYGDPQGLGFLLVAPNGTTAYEFFSATGGPNPTGSINLVLDDGAASAIPNTSTLVGGTYKPTSDANQTGNADAYPSPAPQTFDSAAPTGSATFQQEFGGLGLAGTWKLYLSNRVSTGTPGTIGGGWCLNLTMQQGAHGTQTTVNGTPNPAAVGATVTLTANVAVTDGSGLTVNAGTVSFVDGSATLGTAPVVNGTATLQTSSLAEGTHHIVAGYGGSSSPNVFGVSSNNFNQRVDHATVPSGTYTFCNAGVIALPGGGRIDGAAGPYPSNIVVANLPGTVKALTVTLKQLTANRVSAMTSLLAGPGGANLDFFSREGGVGSITSPIDLTFDDTAANGIPSSLIAGGTFKPSSAQTGNTYPACPPNAANCQSPPVGPPLPSNPFSPSNYAQPAGSGLLGNAGGTGVFGGTTASAFNGNGEWSLYLSQILEDANNVDIAGGWCLNFTENLPVLTIVKTHSGNFSQGEQGAQFSVTVANQGPGPTGGTVTVSDTMPSGLTPVGAGTGTDASWNCTATGQTISCTNSTAVAAGSSYPALALAANVAGNATSPLSNTASVSGGGSSGSVNSAADSVTIVPAPDLTVSKSHTGDLVQGQSVAYQIAVSNIATGSTTSGQVTVADTAPAGFTYNSGASVLNGWACSAGAQVTCTITQAVAGGNSYPALTLAFTIPASASGSVTNTAVVSGGGETNTS
ncbi:MAG: beta strand repeat-containing protein, partial [Bryobacteraceae bacterium]